MRSDVDVNTQNYLNAREGVVEREFLWLAGRNRVTNALETMGLWSDLDTVTVTVISGETRLPVDREYHGSGSLIKIDPIPLVSDLSVRTVQITLSQINEAVLEAVRGYDVRWGTCEIHAGLFNLDTRQLIAPPLPHLEGRINGNIIVTPKVGESGSVTLTVASHAVELTKTNAAKKSDETQKQRNGDRFRKYSTVVQNWKIWWGEEKGGS